MVESLKRSLYFPGAWIFRFFATIRLTFWKPYIIVVTGSSGKTTIMHLLESQLQDKARYTHHANSAYGIPFDILDIHRTTFTSSEWITIAFKCALSFFKPLPKESIYVVEADCDRPGEGSFLADLLKPTITIWASCARTHSLNFDRLVVNGTFTSVDEAIAYEFGHFAARTRGNVFINADNPLINKQMTRCSAEIHSMNLSSINSYTITPHGSTFNTTSGTFSLPYLLPKESIYGLIATSEIMKLLTFPLDPSYKRFHIPPGRSSLFKGINDSQIIDSSYNANLTSMSAVLLMFMTISAPKKWLIIGDMLELGNVEKEEHEKLAELIEKTNPQMCLLLGKLTHIYTYPRLRSLLGDNRVLIMASQKAALDYLKTNIPQKSTILFKGSQSLFLEGIVEHILDNPDDIQHLCRRESIWATRRKRLGL